MQWLVKKLIETRDERNLKNRVTANSYYDNIVNSIIGKSSPQENLGSFKTFNQIKQKNNSIEKLISINENFNKNKADKISENINEENNLEYEKLNKIKDLISVQEKALEAKYSYFNKGRIFRPSNSYNFSYNDPLRIYFNLIEYGMNKDITFQKNLIELLKKKGLVDENSKEKETSKILKNYLNLT